MPILRKETEELERIENCDLAKLERRLEVAKIMEERKLTIEDLEKMYFEAQFGTHNAKIA
jgi:hypothetical protein